MLTLGSPLAGRSALGENGRCFGSMLCSVVHDVHQHLPNGHPLVDVPDEAVRHGRQPGIDSRPLEFAQLIDRRQRVEFGLGGLAGVLESVAPALRRTQVVDEDGAQTPLADDVRLHPHGRF